MPTIKITGGPSLEIESQQSTPALAHYLQNGLVFALRKTSPAFQHAYGKHISELDSTSFPVSLSAREGRSFVVSSAMVSVTPQLEASIDVLSGDKASDFGKALGAGAPTAPFLVSFALGAEIDSGPSGTVGDFSFGLLSGAGIKISNYCPVSGSDLFQDAVQRAISGLTLPHDLDDLRALPANHICTVEGKASLKFTASVRYNLLNNTLAAAPVEILSQSLNLKASSGPKLQVVVDHSNTHQLTIGAVGKNTVRLSVSLAADADIEESFDFSIGVSGNIGGTDALQFLIEHVSSVPDKDLAQIRTFLSAQEQSDLSAQIKTVVQAATKGGITASLHDAFNQSREDKFLFIYEVDLDALDAVSSAAVQSALRGDFTQLTALGANLAGIKEIKSVSTLTLAKAHTLTLHLLGILNFSDVGSFTKKMKVAHVGDTDEIVLAATDIKVVQNTISPEHLRKVLTKSAMITSAADSSPRNPDFKFEMVFFFKKAGASRSDLRQMRNSLAYVSSLDAAALEIFLHGASAPDIFVDFSLQLDKTLSTALFKSPGGSAYRTTDDFVVAGQKAMAAILADDPESAERLPLFSVDLTLWKYLREGGSAANVRQRLQAHGLNSNASWTDFVSIDWWAQAMSKMAAALAASEALMNAQREVLKESEAGFDVPWALLATNSLLTGPSHVRTNLLISGQKKNSSAVMGAAGH